MKHSLLTVSTLALVLSPSAFAQEGSGEVEVPHRFVPNTPARADEVNANFETLAEAATETKSRVDALESDVDELRTDVDANAGSASANATAIADLDARLTPLEDLPRPSNTVIVAQEGGDFDSIVAALDSIATASSDNPFLVLVFPGRYQESEIALVREGVHLKGMGSDSSILATERSSGAPNEAAAAVRLFEGGRISDLGIVNDGQSSTSIGILGFDLPRSTLVEGVHVSVSATGGSGHFGMHVTDSDLTVRDSLLEAAGATVVNSAFGSVDTGGPFAQPRIEGSRFLGSGPTTGMGMQISSTAATVVDTLVDGDFRAISATVAGISRIHHSQIETLGFNPVYETTGSASILSAGVGFVGGDPLGLASSFRYVHCYGPAFQPIDDGDGSDIQ